MRAHFASEAQATYLHRVDELLARPSEVLIHRIEFDNAAGAEHLADGSRPLRLIWRMLAACTHA